ncbi:MAG: DUF790 family protein [Promethearchaeota archaeon]
MDESLIELVSKGNGIYTPSMLSDEDAPVIEKLVDYLENCIGKPFNLVKEEFPAVSSDRIRHYRALKEILLSRYYHAVKRAIPSFLNHAKGTVDDSQLRLALFDLINERYHGFTGDNNVPDGNDENHRHSISKELASTIGIHISSPEDAEAFLSFLFRDHVDNLVFQRVLDEKPVASHVIRTFNKELNHAVARSSKTIEFRFKESLTGTQYRKLHYVITRSGLECEIRALAHDIEDIDLNKNKFSVSMSKPIELTGRQFRLSNAMASCFSWIYKNNHDNLDRPPVFIREYRKRDVVVELGNLDASVPIDDAGGAKDGVEVTFDSKVEQILFKQLASSLHMLSTIERDSEIIAIQDDESTNAIVMIPDFQVTFHGHSLFIEVVGFWTEQYKEKKLQKLHLLEKMDARWKEKLILVIDTRIEFPETDFPSFYYKSMHFPVGEITNYIERWERGIYEQFSQDIRSRLPGEVKELLSIDPIITHEMLKEKLGFHSMNEVKQFLKDEWEHLDMKTFAVRLAPRTLVSRNLVKEWFAWIRKVFAENGNEAMDRNHVVENLPASLPEHLIDHFLRFSNHSIKYHGLVDVKIIPPSRKR